MRFRKLYVALRSSLRSHIDVMTSDDRGHYIHLIEDSVSVGRVQLAPDFELKELFWSDYNERKISYMDFDGNSPHTFLGSIAKPASMAVVGEDVFWTTTKSLILNWTPKHNLAGTKSMLMKHSAFAAMPVNIELATITPIVVSQHICAARSASNCSHVCVALSATSHSCLCPAGMIFADEAERRCVDKFACEFRCSSGECIGEINRCDGYKDCVDNSDEENCGSKKSPHRECTFEEFECADRSKCIDRALRCNQINDCSDRSDEASCSNYDSKTKCHEMQYMCSNGECIDSTLVCDGHSDCSDGSDEKSCKDPSRVCGADKFTCLSDRKCIPISWRCDGTPECFDRSDEANCTRTDCADGMKRCTHGVCISKSLWCDGNNDCGDFSDEESCESAAESEFVCGRDDEDGASYFQCESEKSICLDVSARCNGTIECPKAEDEVDCEGCPPGEFRCANKRCIDYAGLCDGKDDCGDRSDEANCRNKTRSHFGALDFGFLFPSRACHPVKEFDCGDGLCIDFDRVCDKKADCATGNDESETCRTACSGGHPCEQKCIKSPQGPICACDKGYELNADKNTCRNINECANGMRPCAQMCADLEGSFRCSCFSEFQLMPDRVTCKSVHASKYYIYSDGESIYRHQNSSLEVIWWNDAGAKVVDMDHHFESNLLYFSIENQDSIFEKNLSSGHLRSVEQIGSHPKSLAVDWVTGNVYFVSELPNEWSVNVCHMEDRHCMRFSALTKKEKEKITGLAIDPLHRRLFVSIVRMVTLTETVSNIFAFNLDGSYAAQFELYTGKDSITSITCDVYSETVFFTDSATRTLWSIKYDGTAKRSHFHKSNMLIHPVGVMLLESRAFMTHSGSVIVSECPLFGSRECEHFALNVSPTKFIVAQKSRQPDHENPCAAANCSMLCVLGSAGAKCMCEDGTPELDSSMCNQVVRKLVFPALLRIS